MRIGRVVLGVILLVIGAGLAAAGIVGITSFGPGGTMRVTSPPLASADGYALVQDVVAVSAGFPGSEALGTTTIGARSAGGDRLFIGLGETPDVNDYLSGVPFEAIQQDGSTWQANTVPGPDEPKPPEDEDFWIRQSGGNDPSIDFSGGRGTTTFVVMNADASRGVDALITVGYTSTLVFPLSVAAIVIGALLAVAGLILLLRARRREPEPAPDTAGAEPPPTAASEPSAQQSEQPEQAVEEPQSPESAPGDFAPKGWFREQDNAR